MKEGHSGYEKGPTDLVNLGANARFSTCLTIGHMKGVYRGMRLEKRNLFSCFLLTEQKSHFTIIPRGSCLKSGLLCHS